MSSDSTPFEIGKTFERNVFDQLVVGAGVGVHAVEATGATQLFEKSLENQVYQRAALQRIHCPAVLRTVSRVDPQHPTEEELKRACGPGFDARRGDAPHRLHHPLHVARTDYELGIPVERCEFRGRSRASRSEARTKW